MPITVAEVNAAIEALWPLDGASAWDAPGLLSGDPGAPVSRVHFAVDAVSESVDEAIGLSADLLLVHHPLLLRGVTTVAEDRYKGAMLARLIRAGCALVSAHTNADVVDSGTSGVFARLLSLTDIRPIVGARNGRGGTGRVGTLPTATTLGRLARQLADLLPATATGVRVSGDYELPVSTVALCGGAGDSLLSEPLVRGADVYITSDLRHHPASEARENARAGGGPALIDVSHWASEWLWLDQGATELRAALPSLAITVSELRTDPWDFVVTQ
ncbi:MAG: Nif3-like dinuclear metal center hexameric protein [Burkholderiaceae bacterium]|nr:Nif3-like dinuclear metal center hexameric protein [Microbacteriaceae bacterium]